jgi:hypothetical protein
MTGFPILPMLFNSSGGGGAPSVVTTKDGAGVILRVGTQVIKFGAGLNAVIFGGEVLVTATAAALTGTPYQVLSFDNLGALITVGSKFKYDDSLQRIYNSGAGHVFTPPFDGNQSLIWGAFHQIGPQVHQSNVSGQQNTCATVYNSVIGGEQNALTNLLNCAVFGRQNVLTNVEHAIVAGRENTLNRVFPAKNQYSAIFGYHNTVETDVCMAVGFNNQILGHAANNADYCAAFGQGNIIRANVGAGQGYVNYGYAFGFLNTIESNVGPDTSGFVFGRVNKIQHSDWSAIFGRENNIICVVHGTGNFICGYQNNITGGTAGFVTGRSNTASNGGFAAGQGNAVSGLNCAVFGANNTANNSSYTLVCGIYNEDLANSLFEVGNGSGPANKLSPLRTSRLTSTTEVRKLALKSSSSPVLVGGFTLPVNATTDSSHIQVASNAPVISNVITPIAIPTNNERLVVVIENVGVNNITFKHALRLRLAGGLDVTLAPGNDLMVYYDGGFWKMLCYSPNV